MDLKKCCRCGLLKPRSEFSKDKHMPSGLSYKCRDCNNRLSNKYYHSKKGKIIRKEYKIKNELRIKETNRIYQARSRGLVDAVSGIELELPCDLEYHHINDVIVIPIPKDIHRKFKGSHHVKLCNEWIKSNYMLDLTIFEGGKCE